MYTQRQVCPSKAATEVRGTDDGGELGDSRTRTFGYTLVSLLLALGVVLSWFALISRVDRTAYAAYAVRTDPAQSIASEGIAAASTSATLTPSPTLTPECQNFDLVSVPQVEQPDDVLHSITVVSSSDVWALGDYLGPDDTSFTLVEHWDGSTWSIVPSPNPVDATIVYPKSIAAISASDVWAVGYYVSEQEGYKSLTMHWDGDHWNLVASPNPGNNCGCLTGVSGTSANDVWAVGYYSTGGNNLTLTLHWDGSQWNIVPSPNISVNDSNYLNSVDALASGEVWAVGYVHHADGTPSAPLALHWDGAAWSIVPTPPMYSVNGYLNQVSAITPNDAWAVGSTVLSGLNNNSTLILHWDGAAWSIVSSPNPASAGDNRLYGVEAVTSSDAWAVGYYITSTVGSGNPPQALVEYWDGAQWSVVPAPQGATGAYKRLYSVAALSTSDMWLAGYDSTYAVVKTFTAHYDGSAWSYVPSPNTGAVTASSLLQGVDGASPNDIWAVGGASGSLIDHWDGTQWSIISHPQAEFGPNLLQAVSVHASDDVWAVGEYNPGTDGSLANTLTMHWDGVQWSVVPSPNHEPSGAGNDYLLGVDAAAANDAWAVGYMDDDVYFHPTIMHWDGTQWVLATFPDVRGGILRSVVALSANDAWAVGDIAGGPYQTLMMHWNGSQWNVVASPNPGGPTHFNRLFGVSAVSANDIWAVGMYEQPDRLYNTLTIHWDGQSWSVVPSPNQVGYRYNQLFSVSALSANDVWAAGQAASDVPGITSSTLAMHWTGSSWNIVPSANAGTSENNTLTGIVALSPQDVWAVGTHGNSSLAEQYVLQCSSSTPTPTATATATTTAAPTDITTSPTPTFTPTQLPSTTPIFTTTSTSTNTPASTSTHTPTPTPTQTLSFTSTPTACSIQFTDVPQGSTFYPFVHCLACLGIINGYPCGGQGEPCNPNNNPYFRPSNPITRGQLSKIVSNAAGFSEAHTEQSFEDVAIGSTFYDFIERLASRSIINGYPCGGDGEPCGGGNLPYFRPSANVTRGQTSKIAAIADALPAPPTGQQTFEDVPEASTFWSWIESLAGIGAINGYPCGGVGEPCGPANRPYFRPSVNVSRGQAAKIVSNTFFPGCVIPARFTS